MDPAPRSSDPRLKFLAGLGAAVVIGLVVFLIVGGSDDSGSDGAAASADQSAATSTGADAGGGCTPVDEPAPKGVELDRPDLSAPPAGTTVTFMTNCGDFTVTLDVKRAPQTSASFAYLAEQGVFANTAFHRVAPGFVIQGGDPAGDGTGGPGYSVDERPPSGLVYERGLVAMAKSGAEPPGRSGSQFFVVTAPADAGLPPDYALVGRVTSGYKTVVRIEALGQPGADGPPSSPVVIESATVRS